jgi:ABC-type nitrate/sulfonate/bicarbonate transport system substrate-binding protein
VRSFVAAVQEGFADCQKDQQAAVDALAKEFPGKVDKQQATIALREVLNSLHTERTTGKPTGWIAPQDFTDTLATLGKYAGLKGAKSPGTYYTNDFVG